MKRLAWNRFSFSLSHPVQLRGQWLDCREGIYLELTDTYGHVRIGEAAPLPGFSQETVDDIEAELTRGSLNFKGFPSLQFAYEWATLDFEKKSVRQPIQTNALLMGPKTVEQFYRKKAQGFTCFKLKVGFQMLQHDIDQVKELVAHMAPQHTLRLDANQAWTLSEAIDFGKRVAHPQIDYIEEPTSCWEDWEHFYNETGIPLAVDETVVRIQAIPALFPGLKAVVLKPTLLGFLCAQTLAFEAIQMGLHPVISSCFETEVGLEGLRYLASTFPVQVPHGVTTCHW